jgi:hypothetical protein
MDQQQFFQEAAVVTEPGLGLEEGFLPGTEAELAADALFLAGQVELVNRAIGIGEGPGLDTPADAAQVRIGFLEGVFRDRGEAEIFQRTERQAVAEGADGGAERSPFGPGGLKQAYFVFREEDEIAVRICAETAFGCRRAEASERFQSSLVIVLKSGSFDRSREELPVDEGGLAGEVVLHGSAMRGTSVRCAGNATGFCRQIIRSRALGVMGGITMPNINIQIRLRNSRV